MSSPFSAAQESLLRWYQTHGRHHLPWRNASAYEVFISEMMLQQTQVATVLERFYYPFLERFPTLESIAHAEESEILNAWKGLGYYSRARNIHTLARQTNGALPSRVEELLKLPGIGAYTARAVACFGFGASVPIVDGNIKRVLRRFFAITERGEAVIWRRAEEFLNQAHAFDHNQALLDIGALVCRSKNPLCESCPLAPWCAGREEPQRYSAPQSRAYEPLELHYGFCWREGRVAMVKSTERLYKGLWGFPRLAGVPESGQSLGSVRHGYTKYKITAHLYIIKEAELPRDEAIEWVALEAWGELPVSILALKLWERYWRREGLGF